MHPTYPQFAMQHRSGLVDRLSGALAAALIRAVLTGARLWTRLTGSAWHG